MMSTPAVGKLQITRYESAAGPYHTESIVRPSWEMVEAAIRRLDRCLYPFVWLYRDPRAEEDDVPQFEVTGGNGAYVVAIRPDGSELWLQNPSGGSNSIDVWVSDQGASFLASVVCTSLAEVLRVARHFFDHGEPAPLAVWA